MVVVKVKVRGTVRYVLNHVITSMIESTTEYQKSFGISVPLCIGFEVLVLIL